MNRSAPFIFVASVLLVASSASAQQFDPLSSPSDTNGGIVGQFDPADLLAQEPARISARVAPATAEHPAVLLITAQIAPGRHTYAISQPPGGPRATKIDLAPSSDYRLLDTFRADPAPQKRIQEGPVWTGLEIQEHTGEVTWFAPIEITAGVDPASLNIAGKVHVEVCEEGGSCIPIEKDIAARIGSESQLPPAIGDAVEKSMASKSAIPNPKSEIGAYQSKTSAVKISGQIVPSRVRPGESARIELTATLPKGGRIYARSDRDDRKGTKPVLIAIGRASGLVPQRATTDAVVKIDNSTPQFGEMRFHEGAVTWTVPVEVPASAPPGEYAIEGLFGYQACEYGAGGNVCEFPQAVHFNGTVQVANQTSETPAPITFTLGPGYSRIAEAAATFANFLDRNSGGATDGPKEPESPAVAQAEATSIQSSDQYQLELIEVAAAEGSLGYYIAMAFIGGLILNLMPCVLPVIGLKVMSFVEQAGKSRSHALVLNLWFAAGIVSVFIILGLLAASLNLGWGGQFGNTAFNVTLAAVVFAMALSLLGVWEVPIPGFFGTGSIQNAAAKEGPLGAFLKGVVTTVLATPCTAPFMGAAIAWAVTQSLATTLAVFGSLGLGMASPYLLVGVFPELLRFLPKPGAWMETFKQVSGFVLLGTVIFILSYIEPAAIIPTIALLLGVGLACWLIARTPLTASLRDRLQAWGSACAILVVFLGISFGWLYRVANAPMDAAWQPFSLERLKQMAIDEGRTVIVDFSADWCLSCKVLEQTVLHTKAVEQAIAGSGAVTMYGDYTDYPQEIQDTLRALGANGVPVIAIFPGKAPYEPTVFQGGYTQQGLITALQQAEGRSQPAGSVAEATAAPPPLN